MTSNPIPTPAATQRRTRPTAIRVGIGALAMTAAAIAGVSIASAAGTGNETVDTLEVDIAEDGTRFVIDEAPVFDDGFPPTATPSSPRDTSTRRAR